MPTLNYAVGIDDDDGHWSSGNFTYILSRIYIGGAGTANNGFYRFTGISIPAGATITSATVGLYGNGEGTAGHPVMTLYADKAASSPRPSSTADADGRTVTTASVGWNPALTNGAFVQSTDISSVIQELVDAYGATLDTITILHKYAGAATGNYEVAWGYGNSPTTAPTLTITYTAGGLPFFMQTSLLQGGFAAKAGGMQ